MASINLKVLPDRRDRERAVLEISIWSIRVVPNFRDFSDVITSRMFEHIADFFRGSGVLRRFQELLVSWTDKKKKEEARAERRGTSRHAVPGDADQR